MSLTDHLVSLLNYPVNKELNGKIGYNNSVILPEDINYMNKLATAFNLTRKILIFSI